MSIDMGLFSIKIAYFVLIAVSSCPSRKMKEGVKKGEVEIDNKEKD